MADLTHTAGTTLRGNFTYNQPDGTPVDLTGYTVTMWAKQDCGERIPFILDNVDAASGIIAYHLHSGNGTNPPALNSSDLEAGKQAEWVTSIQSNSNYDDTRLIRGTIDVR